MQELTKILDEHFSMVEIASGEYYVKEGQYAKTIGYVKNGLLHSYQINKNGEMITTNFFQEGSFCGSYYSFYQQLPALDFIKAITETKIYTIGFERLQKLFREDLVINQIGRMAIEQVCIQKDIRLSKMLKLDAKSRYLWFVETYPFVIEKTPLKYIASYLGMKPESLSRIRREFIS